MIHLALTIAAGILLASVVLALIQAQLVDRQLRHRTRQERRAQRMAMVQKQIAFDRAHGTHVTILVFLLGLIVWTAALILAGLLGADL